MILGIESSCDESAVAVFDPQKGVIAEWIYSQVSDHSEYGGVVPDLAVRQHLTQFFPLLDFLKEAPISIHAISKIAVTKGPGLVGCLGVGLCIAKTLGELWGVPVSGVNHLRGHAYSPFMHLAPKPNLDDLLPHLGLLVSGGNTLLFEIEKNHKINILGQTMDDAVGEALDKGAKLLGIPYPGGASLEKFARSGDAHAFSFPRAFNGRGEKDFSFSGLKTSLLYQLQKMNQEEIDLRYNDLCASYQEAAVDQLDKKCDPFIKNSKYKSFGLSGGVANNDALRKRLKISCEKKSLKFLAAEKKYSGDNAAMIAFADFCYPNASWVNAAEELSFNPNLKIDDLPPISFAN
jgi:N6-L-threonylcarbamoyladenine synthase